MMSDVLHLSRGARRVDTRWTATRHHRRVIEDHPLGPVEPEDRDLAATRESERDQRACRGADVVSIRSPRGRLPAATDLVLVGDRRRSVRGLTEQAMRNRVARHPLDLLALA